MDFVSEWLGPGLSTSNQHECDSQSSDSELNCSDIVDASDLDDVGSQNRSFNKFQPEQPSTSVSQTLDAQTIINQQILAQLSEIGQRLHKLQKGDCKKSSDLTKVKNISTGARSKATTKSNNKSTESLGQSTITSILLDTANVPFNSLSVPSLTDVRTQISNKKLIRELRNRNNIQIQVLIQKSNLSEAVLLTYLLNIR